MTWWDKYGMSERPVIDNYDDLLAYMDEMVETVLERNETVDFALRTAREEMITPPDGVPLKVWKVIWKPVMRPVIWLTYGTLPEKERRILGLEWTKRDQKRFDRIAKLVKKVFEILPEDKRYMEPGRSQMIKHGMIDGKYKEPRNIAPYNNGGDPEEELKAADGITVSARKPGETGTDGDDGAAARRAAGCPF